MIRKFLTKPAYGSVELGINSVEVFLRLHLLIFYSQTVELSAFSVGVALSIAILWDAITDPLIGRLSDYWRLKYGSRWPLVFVGAIGTVVGLYLLYHPPLGFLGSGNLRWTYLLSAALFLNTTTTFLSIPYSAMIGDYTGDRKERSSFIGWRLAFANFGAILGIAIPGYFLVNSPQTAYSTTAWMIAGVVILFVLVSFPFRPAKGQPIQLQDSTLKAQQNELLSAFQNKAFLNLVVGYFVVNIGLTFNSAAALYYYRLRVEYSESEIQTLLLIFLLVFTASLPLWVWLSSRFGKKWTLISGALALGVSNIFIYPLLPSGEAFWGYLWAAGFGGVLVGSSVLMESCLTDTIDLDHVRQRKERFGLYFGLWKFSGKASRSMAMLITGSLLDWASANAPIAETSDRLAWIFGPGVGGFFALGAVLLIPYKLSEPKCQQVKSILQRRRK